jgi:hypothetical protein
MYAQFAHNFVIVSLFYKKSAREIFVVCSLGEWGLPKFLPFIPLKSLFESYLLTTYFNVNICFTEFYLLQIQFVDVLCPDTSLLLFSHICYRSGLFPPFVDSQELFSACPCRCVRMDKKFSNAVQNNRR